MTLNFGYLNIGRLKFKRGSEDAMFKKIFLKSLLSPTTNDVKREEGQLEEGGLGPCCHEEARGQESDKSTVSDLRSMA